jgi:hypothetical protein
MKDIKRILRVATDKDKEMAINVNFSGVNSDLLNMAVKQSIIAVLEWIAEEPPREVIGISIITEDSIRKTIEDKFNVCVRNVLDAIEMEATYRDNFEKNENKPLHIYFSGDPSHYKMLGENERYLYLQYLINTIKEKFPEVFLKYTHINSANTITEELFDETVKSIMQWLDNKGIGFSFTDLCGGV